MIEIVNARLWVFGMKTTFYFFGSFFELKGKDLFPLFLGCRR
jgi:hypothetical protein